MPTHQRAVSFCPLVEVRIREGELMASQVQRIKDCIVRAYKNGDCTYDGRHIPKEKRGQSGKGSRYHFPDRDAYAAGWDRIFQEAAR